jgi:hypothetical protein
MRAWVGSLFPSKVRHQATTHDSAHPGGNPVSTKPVDSPERLVVQAWMAKELDSPDIDTRLRAMEAWAIQHPQERSIR